MECMKLSLWKHHLQSSTVSKYLLWEHSSEQILQSIFMIKCHLARHWITNQLSEVWNTQIRKVISSLIIELWSKTWRTFPIPYFRVYGKINLGKYYAAFSSYSVKLLIISFYLKFLYFQVFSCCIYFIFKKLIWNFTIFPFLFFNNFMVQIISVKFKKLF